MVFGVLVRDYSKWIGNKLYGPFNTKKEVENFVKTKRMSYHQLLYKVYHDTLINKDEDPSYYLLTNDGMLVHMEIMEFDSIVQAMRSPYF